MKKSFLLLITVFLMHFIFAQSTSSYYVSVENAKQVGINFQSNQASKLNHTKYNDSDFSIKNQVTLRTSNGIDCLHVFNYNKGGFVLVSADYRTTPVLAYSFDGEFDLDNMAPATKSWLEDNYLPQYEIIFNSNIEPSMTILDQWDKIQKNDLSYDKNTKGVDALVDTKWNQTWPYNMFCPEHEMGPGGHVVAGCVATAMAQVMKYWDYPETGMGETQFFYGDYFNVDFGATSYKWEEMTTYANSVNREAIAELIYHCGASVGMSWGYDGSSASTANTVYALKQYFKYRTGVYMMYKSEVTDAEWKFKLKEELDKSHPLIYSGTDLEVGMGHAFVCDGYQDTSYFHFNWGWGGANDGFYFLDDLTPGSNDFEYGQDAVFNITPIDADFCIENTIYTLPEMTFGDGSGDSYYFNNTYCDWIINPQVDSIEVIKLAFTKFDLAENDVLKIYQGSNSNPTLNLVGEYTAGNNPGTLYNWNGNKFYLVFETDAEGQADGWEAYYTTKTSNIQENVLSDISLYPNPANSTLNIVGIENCNIDIYDIYGKLVKNFSETSNLTIDISDLSNGLYFVNIKNDNGIKTLKFIKN